MFSYCQCQTYHRCARFRKPARIRSNSDRIRGSRAYRGRLTPKVCKQKRRHQKLSKIFINRLFKISLSLRCRAPDPVFGQNRILIPAIYTCYILICIRMLGPYSSLLSAAQTNGSPFIQCQILKIAEIYFYRALHLNTQDNFLYIPF